MYNICQERRPNLVVIQIFSDEAMEYVLKLSFLPKQVIPIILYVFWSLLYTRMEAAEVKYQV